AEMSLGWIPSGSTRTVVANRWWLDVETANSWTSNKTLNVQSLEGGAGYFVSVGAPGVGFYSVPSAWTAVTGATTAFSAYPAWVAGARSLSGARSRCASAGFTGGPTVLAQYPSKGYDADYRC